MNIKYFLAVLFFCTTALLVGAYQEKSPTALDHLKLNFMYRAIQAFGDNISKSLRDKIEGLQLDDINSMKEIDLALAKKSEENLKALGDRTRYLGYGTAASLSLLGLAALYAYLNRDKSKGAETGIYHGLSNLYDSSQEDASSALNKLKDLIARFDERNQSDQNEARSVLNGLLAVINGDRAGATQQRRNQLNALVSYIKRVHKNKHLTTKMLGDIVAMVQSVYSL